MGGSFPPQDLHRPAPAPPLLVTLTGGDNCGELRLTSYLRGLRTLTGEVGGGGVILTSGTVDAAAPGLDVMDESGPPTWFCTNLRASS